MEDRQADRWSVGIAIMLALLGLLGAMTAWRIGIVSSDSDDATGDGLAAVRAANEAEVESFAAVAQANDAWLDYERNRQRAEALETAGMPEQASNYWKQAVAHWELVRPDFVGSDHVYSRESHLAASLRDASATNDLSAGPHFDAAEHGYDVVSRLAIAGIVTGAALPLLTAAEILRGRGRAFFGVTGAAVLVLGAVLTGVWWS